MFVPFIFIVIIVFIVHKYIVLDIMYWKNKRFIRFWLFLLCLLDKQNTLHLLVFSIFFLITLLEYLRTWSKKHFTEHQTAFFVCYFYATIQLSDAIQRHFPGQLFFWTSCREGEFPRDFLINVATCLFAYH